MDLWANLNRDLLQLIAEKITRHTDVLRFGATCKQWRSIVTNSLHFLPPKLPISLCLPIQKPLPLLMQCPIEDKLGSINFLSVSDMKSYGKFLVPELNNKVIAGSSNGWLLTVELNSQEIKLLNPLTRNQIPLPSLSTLENPEGEDFGFILKAIISSNANKRNLGDDCIVMAIISELSILSFCRPGDDKWTYVNQYTFNLYDVIPYKGQFYAINETGTTVAYDVSNDDVKMKLIAKGDYSPRRRYLVESTSGELLHVERVLDEQTETFTTNFIVYKLESREGLLECELCWVESESLGDQALFLGLNCSLSLPAQSFRGCKSNCIYFTDDIEYLDSSYDMGVYDLEDRKIQMFGDMDKCFSFPPIWISPNPW
ncbi:uncharacterized protein A4U43_C06F8830 [Asparagus officinalis]|uniref:KIB1-4 beta-propeller domain-containing protein n=1 Tax=Asparagus officinalis TaxID=4686 RepID=A0A5P1ENX6_ASPOF|nr:F-box protein SKIP23-like [Asparagus officinalis]ONK66499.1 uncharacterized protein A4U43_C06F8830 [Asparagus officinalis]